MASKYTGCGNDMEKYGGDKMPKDTAKGSKGGSKGGYGKGSKGC